MDEPISIDPARLSDFVHGPGFAVVLVSMHPAQPFNRPLRQRLRDEHGAQVAFGAVGLADLLISGREVLPFLQESLRGIKASTSFGVLPGYWLFRAGDLLVWDSGLPVVTDVKGLARSALLGAFFSGLTRNWAFVGKALYFATEELAAQRIASQFRQAVADRGAGHRAAPSSRPSTELSWAYQILGTPPGATNREIQAAWRRRRIENHPDRAAQDPAEFQRRSQLSAEINRARDIIMKHRGFQKRPTA